MTLVYITSDVEKLAKKYALQKHLARLQERLETYTVEEIHPSIMERFSPFYRDRQQKFRIMGKLEYVNDVPVMVLWYIFVRGDKAYDAIVEANREERLAQAEKYLPPQEVLEAFVANQVSKKPPQPSTPALDEGLRAWLDPFERESSGEVMIFESPKWVERFESKRFRSVAHRFFDLLNRAINNSEGEPLLEGAEHVYKVESEHGVIYYVRFLLGLPNNPSEEIVLLLDARERPDKAFEEELLKGAILKEGEYQWLNDIPDGLVTTEEQFDQVARNAGRAYYAYFLVDEGIWREIEGIERLGRSSQGGIDRTNPALSAEELRILSRTRHGASEPVLPLFINGRAGSGKSTMLHFLFADYVRRKIERDLPGRLLFLTYTSRLRDEAKRAVRDFFRVGSEFVGLDIDDLRLSEQLNQAFWVFPDFLREFLTQEERLQRFPMEKFVGAFGDFQRIYPQIAPKGYQRFSPDVAWHILRTYIKGYRSQGYLSPEEYAELPSKERTVPMDVYQWVWDQVWPRYKEAYWDTQDLVRHLIENDRVPADYAVVFCDEAQDFTRIELQFLWRLLAYRKYELKGQGLYLRIPLVLAGDPFQTLNPTGFRWEALKAGFHEEVEAALDPAGIGLLNVRYEELHYNYRSTAPIVRFGNLLQFWRKRLFGARGEILQRPWREEHILPPRLYILNREVTEDLFLEKVQGEEVVILPCEYNQEDEFVQRDPLLRRLKDSPRPPTFLSPMAVKGLEFPRVWLYKFGEYCPDNFFDSLIPYDDRLRNEFFLNKLYVAATRAQRDLLVIDTAIGEQRLWKHALNTNPISDKTLPKGVEGITRGGPYKLDRDFEQLDPLEMADQLAETDNPRLLRQASDFYRRAGEERKALYCEARALELEHRYAKAGDLYLHLRGKYLQDAERCFWLAQAWEKLEELYAIYWKGQGDPFYQKATHIMRARQSPELVSLEDLKAFFEDFEASRAKRAMLLEQKSTREALCQAADLILHRNADKSYATLLQTLAAFLEQSLAFAIILGEERAAWICYHANKWEEAIAFWNGLPGQKPPEYYLARARVSSGVAEKLHWLAQARDYEGIIQLADTLRTFPDRLQALSAENRHLVGRALLHKQRYEDALAWYQETGMLREAFEVLEKHWGELAEAGRVLKDFFEKVLHQLEENPSKEWFEFAEEVARVAQQQLPWQEGEPLLRAYWKRLGELDRWDWLLESVKHTKSEYSKSAHFAVARIVAESSEVRNADVNDKRALTDFLLERFVPQASRSWLQRIPVEVPAAAVEKVGLDLDALKWYGALESVEHLTDRQRQFVRRRWLKVMHRRLQHLSREGRGRREQKEFREKLEAWNILREVINAEPEYPVLESKSQEQTAPEVEVGWDGKVCKLSQGAQIVLIDVARGDVTPFDVEMTQSEQEDKLLFEIPAWRLSGQLSNHQLELIIEGKSWKTFRVEA